MFRLFCILAVVPAMLVVVTACDNNEADSSTGQVASYSFEVSYTTVSVMGRYINDDTANDAGPEISSNGLELYFNSDRAGGTGGLDIYVTTRASTADDWVPATSLGDVINSTADEHSPSISSDGLTLLFTSNRVGGEGDFDLYMSTRLSVNDAWSAPVNLGNVVNTQYAESSPDISADGLSLYFSSNVPGGYGQNDLYISTRATLNDPWSPPVNLGDVVNSVDYDSSPEIASDGLSLFFHSTRRGGTGTHSIWRASRMTTSDSWSQPEALPEPVNSAFIDVHPSLSNDWQTLYFASGLGSRRDVWMAVP